MRIRELEPQGFILRTGVPAAEVLGQTEPPVPKQTRAGCPRRLTPPLNRAEPAPRTRPYLSAGLSFAPVPPEPAMPAAPDNIFWNISHDAIVPVT
jgi:hypothetical protein